MSYVLDHPIVERAPESARAAFIRRTYGHLAGAVLAFVALETALLNLPNIQDIVLGMIGNRLTWLLIIGGYIGVSWLAQSWAQSDSSRGLQYVGLSLYIVAMGVIFLPLLYIADHFFPGQHLIPTAGILTLSIFAGLTLAAFVTQRDFSFLGPIVSICCMLTFAVILAGMLFGFGFPLFIAFAMVGVMSAAILYQTSNIIHHYRTDQHVAAALALFAAVATLFYYILYILVRLNSGGRD